MYGSCYSGRFHSTKTVQAGQSAVVAVIAAIASQFNRARIAIMIMIIANHRIPDMRRKRPEGGMDVNPSHPSGIGQAVAGPIICRSCAPTDCGVQAPRSRQH